MGQIAMPANMGSTIARVAAIAGPHVGETGGFLLGKLNTSEAVVLALTGSKGITRHEDLFQISGLALSALFEWADDHDMTVLAQWHSHRVVTGLSPTDVKDGLNVQDFQTTVVPYYHNPPSNPAGWGWWTYNGQRWVASPSPRLTTSAFSTITFEEGNVRES